MWRKKIQKGAAEIYTLATLQQLRPTPAEFVILFKCCSVFVFDSIKAHFALFCLQLISTSQEPAGPEKRLDGNAGLWVNGYKKSGKSPKPIQSNPADLQNGTQQHVAPNQMRALKKWRVLVSDLGCEYAARGFFYRQPTINYQVQANGVADADGLKALRGFIKLQKNFAVCAFKETFPFCTAVCK